MNCINLSINKIIRTMRLKKRNARGIRRRIRQRRNLKSLLSKFIKKSKISCSILHSKTLLIKVCKHFALLYSNLYFFSFNDTDSSEDEGIADYKIGGYHPMHIGEVLIDRYVIV